MFLMEKIKLDWKATANHYENLSNLYKKSFIELDYLFGIMIPTAILLGFDLGVILFLRGLI